MRGRGACGDGLARCRAQMGGLGSVAAPGFLLLGFATGATFVPFLVFGSAVCVAGFAMPVLPETLDAPAPATVQARALRCTGDPRMS